MISELQPVILAAGEGSKLFPLSENIPKCLLPIGNKPMIWYTINYLEKYGFEEFFVVVRKGALDKFSEVLQTHCQPTSKFEFIVLEDEEDIGTAETLKLLKGKTKIDLLVVSGDMVTDAALYRLVDTYRTYDATLCVMLSKHVDVHPQSEQSKQTKGKSKVYDPNAGSRDFVAVEPKEGRLLYLSNEADLEQDSIVFKKSLLKKYPNIKLKSNLVDAHLYIIKNWLINYLIESDKFESIKSDFVPHIIRKQFSKPKLRPVICDSMLLDDGDTMLDDNRKDIFSFCCVDELVEMTKGWSGYQGNCLKDPIKCYAYTSDDFCLRVNTLPSYTFMNRQIVKMKDSLAPNSSFIRLPPTVTQTGKAQIGNDCLVGDSVCFSNNITVKKSVLGRHCVVGSNVRIINSIVMDHVTIADGCTIQGSILCNGCVLAPNCSLTNCHVSSGTNILENSDLKGQSITTEEMEFDSDGDDAL